MSIVDDTLREIDRRNAERDGAATAENNQPIMEHSRRGNIPAMFTVALLLAIALWMGYQLISGNEQKQTAMQVAATTPVVTAPPVAIPKLVSNVINVTAPTDWISTGWRLYDAGQVSSSVTNWKDGFVSLPDSEMVMVIYVGSDKAAAKDLLISAGEQTGSVMFDWESETGILWYVISAPGYASFPDALSLIEERTGIEGLKGRLKSALLSRMNSGNVDYMFVREPTGAAADDIPLGSLEVEDEPEVQVKIAELAPLSEEQILNMDLNRVRGFISDEKYQDAIRDAERLKKSHPDKWEPYFLSGTAWLSLGDLDMAEKSFDGGLANNKENVDLWLQLVIVEQQREEHEKALMILYDLLKLKGRRQLVYLNIGYSSDALGRAEEAEAAYRKFMDLTANDPDFTDVRQQVVKRLAK